MVLYDHRGIQNTDTLYIFFKYHVATQRYRMEAKNMRKTAFKQTLLNLRCHVKYLTMSYQVYLEDHNYLAAAHYLNEIKATAAAYEEVFAEEVAKQ